MSGLSARCLVAGCLAGAMAMSAAADDTRVKISFKTLACDGSRGFASVDADAVIKAKAIQCAGTDPVKRTYQLLVSTPATAQGGHTVYYASEAEVEQVFQQIEAYQRDKREFLRKGTRIKIE